MTKVNNFQTQQAMSLAEHTQEVFENLPEVAGEHDFKVLGNLITITFIQGFQVTVSVSLTDTPDSVHQRFVDGVTAYYDEQEAVERYDRENYEHSSVTQGYAFDSLTC